MANSMDGQWWTYIGADGPDDLNKKKARRIEQLLGGANPAIQFAGARAANRRGMQAVNQAYDRASAGALKLAEQTKRTVLENQGSRMAGAGMDLGARGFGNSSLAALAERGVRGDTTRALQAIDDAFSRQNTSIEANRASALNDLYGREGGIYSQEAGYGNQLRSQLAQIIAGFGQAPKKKNGWQQAFDVATSLGGAALGGWASGGFQTPGGGGASGGGSSLNGWGWDPLDYNQ